jgi:lipopolysaccharide export system protein LptC
MDTKKLYVAALIIVAISSGYYYLGGKGKKLEVDSSKSMTYSAEVINLTQTDEKGLVSLKAQADRLEQDMQKHTAHLDNLHAYTFQNARPDGTFYAKVANSYDDNAKVIMSDEVIATRFLESGEKMMFKTTELTGFPKTRELQTDKQITVESPQANFISHGMKANFNNGQYEFFNIRGTYER